MGLELREAYQPVRERRGPIPCKWTLRTQPPALVLTYVHLLRGYRSPLRKSELIAPVLGKEYAALFITGYVFSRQ